MSLTLHTLVKAVSMNIWIVIPAYNEERLIGDNIENLKREGYEQIIVVDDGSQDKRREDE
ncbi:hypothetical protein AKJ48_03850 [candidate division MSBL1 archaeon SCGC-AAA261O19]|uniref:Glycosyltransferase 2-like domain-containing protein n=1 Tax=candidate division MSBL1 archaeon SCGC-AAA261O19 TaxID=1698277 RepID=A0A133VAR6_9EURY|nr:hypothetical protein AKJ48_03850 [candidate division MSBL1 archaeon SCGC-AAA261O19]